MLLELLRVQIVPLCLKGALFLFVLMKLFLLHAFISAALFLVQAGFKIGVLVGGVGK